jgi:hypothetical protein
MQHCAACVSGVFSFLATGFDLVFFYLQVIMQHALHA